MEENRKIEIIELVDKGCEERVVTFEEIWNTIRSIIFVVVIILLGYFLFLMKDIIFAYASTLPENEVSEYLVSKLLVFAALVVSFSSLFISLSVSIFKISRRRTSPQIEYYYKKMENRVTKSEQPILKSLIRMKCMNRQLDLIDSYRIDPSIFSDQALLTRLYKK